MREQKCRPYFLLFIDIARPCSKGLKKKTDASCGASRVKNIGAWNQKVGHPWCRVLINEVIFTCIVINTVKKKIVDSIITKLIF